MKYQILVKGRPMHPTNGEPYEFDTYQKALDTVNICYGRESLGKDVEIKEINNFPDGEL
jgi:hypothetical protein